MNDINANQRPDQYPWVDLAKKEGWPFILDVVKRLSPEVAPLFPALPVRNKVDDAYQIPDLHSDVLWMYGVFLKMYRKDKQLGIDWFKTNLKPQRQT